MWDNMPSDTTSRNSLLKINGTNCMQNQFRPKASELILNYYFKEWNFSRYKPSTKLLTQKQEKTRINLNDDSVSPCNLIDLNKILLEHEEDLLKKYWLSWRRSVKDNRSVVKSNVKGKGLHKNLVNKSYTTVRHTTSDGSLKNEQYDSEKKYFKAWKELTRNHVKRKSITRPQTYDTWENPESKLDTSELMRLLYSKSASNYERNVVSKKYANKKKDFSLATSQNDAAFKIEKFLNAIKAINMKTGKRFKPENSIVCLSHPSRGKSQRIEHPIINHQTRGGDADNSLPEEGTAPYKTSRISACGDSERTQAMAFIKEEVDASLAEAQTLLENTIAASYKGNCARRKSFKHINREGPLPAEMPASNLVDRMKMRELQRAARWQQSRERREKLEKEREMRIIEEQREKDRQHELSKKLKLFQQREIKIESLLREKHLEEVRERYHMLNMKALKHYDENLLHKGMQALINALKISAMLKNQASSHYNKVLLWRAFHLWKNLALLSTNMSIFAAERFQKTIILRRCLKIFSKLQREYILNKQAAIDFCDMQTQERAFVHWHQYTCNMLIEQYSKCEIADLYYNRCLLKKSFHCWKSLPAVMESERTRERIQNSFRMRVLDIFPDFCPQSDNET